MVRCLILFFSCGFGGCGGGLVTMMVVWFFILFVGLVVYVLVVVVVVVVGVADGKGGCGWCCGFFFGSGIYNFIVGDILFYCDIYIILLC